MKFLLLALFVSAACANLQNENTGAWNTYIAASDHLDKVAENGPLRGYLRTISCLDQECNSVSLGFWMKNNGKCQAFSMVGNKAGSANVYYNDFSGENSFEFVHESKNMLVVCIRNTDENGTVTKIVEAVARPGHELTEEECKDYNSIVMKQGLPIENVMNIISKDTCPK